MLSAPSLQLCNADSELLLCPAAGGAIARFRWRGRDILRPASEAAIANADVRQMASYPLVPYSNRIGLAQLMADGTNYSLRPNFPPEPHSIHGFGWQQAWQLGAQSSDTVEMILTHVADADWPFACEARQTVRLSEQALHICLSVRNNAAQPMPVGLGFHPFFPLLPGVRLQTDWQSMWQNGPDRLPTVLGPVPSAAQFSRSRSLDGWQVDHCFTAWSRRARLDYPSHQVQLEASAECEKIVCFAPDDGRGFIALEPVSNINNAFALAAQGVPDSGMRTLAPGQNFSVTMTISVQLQQTSHA